MSKFFAEGNPSEDELSEKEELEQIDEKKPKQKMLFRDVETSESEEEKRVVKTEKDKRFTAMRDIIKKIYDKIKINDFVAISTEFMELNKQLEKSRKIVDKEGIPRFYIRICFMIENLTCNLSAEDKKKLSASNNKSFNILKQHIKKNNKNYTKEIEEFKKNPIDSEEEKPAKGGSDSEEDERKHKVLPGNEDESEDSYDEKFGKDDEESEEEIEEEVDNNETNPEIRRLKWLKKKDVDSEEEDEKERVEKEKEKEKELERKKKQIERGLDRKKQELKRKDLGASKADEKKIEFNMELITKKLKEIVENRGKFANLKTYLDNLNECLGYVHSDRHRLEIILILVPVRYDLAKYLSASYMPRDYWLESLENLREFLKILKNKDLKIHEIATYSKDGESYYKEHFIYDALSTQIESLDSELMRGFKSAEYSSIEYAERLNDLAKLLRLAREIQEFYESIADLNNASKTAFVRLENLYFMHDSTLKGMRELALNKGLNVEGEFYDVSDSKELLAQLATLIYRHSEDKNKIKAILYQIYHHCIHNRYLQARDYLLMSHVSDHVQTNEISNQVLYNKVIVQLALAAFRLGYITDVHITLQELIGTMKLKELLSQSISTKNVVVEKEEKRRLLPYHLHINIEYVESVYLISAMLLEIPNIAKDVHDSNRKVISKFFRRIFESYDKSHFIAPPENYRDYIYAASKELIKGDWRKCYNHLLAMNFWTKVHDASDVKAKLLRNVKENSFKCYLFTFQNCFEKLSLSYLTDRMELDLPVIRSLISKMISNKDIQATLDENGDSLVFENKELSNLQKLSSSIIEKINSALSLNEKILDAKFGNYGFAGGEFPLAQAKNPKTKKTSTLINQNKKQKIYKSSRK